MIARARWIIALSLLLAGVPADSAFAQWQRVSPLSSRTRPYFVCPGAPRAARCAVIQDPTRGSGRRGRVAAGAITAGPEEEPSPAMYGTGVEGGYAPSDLRSAYRLPSSSAGAGQTVAIVDAFDDPKAETDLAAYRSQYALGECTSAGGCFEKVDQHGGAAFPPPSRLWAREISLDLDMVSAICPNCHILLVEANNEEAANLAAAEDEAAKLGATEISDSYEEPESSAEAAAYDHRGIPVVAAGGDRAFGGGVVSPAANPHVIAVGGTKLVPSEERRHWTETVWHSEGGGGTGSGCSREPKPVWQTDPLCSNRTTNDVAAVADPNTPVSAYDSYETAPSWLLLGGTSVSAPIVAAAMALASPYTRTFDGARALYLEVLNGGRFNDVISGANGSCGGTYLCEAEIGYDAPSGLGTPNGAPEVPPPSATTSGASLPTQAQVTLFGSVSPHGVGLSQCAFEYGTTTAYTSYTPCSSLPTASTSASSVSAAIGGLAPGTLYHFRLHVAFEGGSAYGADVTFKTAAPAPSVVSAEASNVTQSSATLNALVNPNGAAVTGCAFEYGTTAYYGSAQPCATLPGQGFTPVAVSATIERLAAAGTYHFRLVATSAGGTSYGPDSTVTLLPLAPTVGTRAATAIGRTSATLNATVDANGGALTACEFEFNSADTLVPCSVIPAPSAGATGVSARVAGLAPGSIFRYRIVAANAGGTTYGLLREFASLPTASQLAARSGARLASPRLLVFRNGTVRVTIRCPMAHRPRCRGTIALSGDPSGAEAERPGAKSRAIASGAFVARSGSAVTLHLKLSGLAWRMLARTSLVHARATVRTIGATGVSAWHAAVTLSASSRT